jgi:hypothetical protein
MSSFFSSFRYNLGLVFHGAGIGPAKGDSIRVPPDAVLLALIATALI